MPPLAKNIVSCYNIQCPNAHRVKYKAPLKCSTCRTAYYCDKKCQRQHWPTHKEFCSNWAETAKNNGEVTVVAIKKKMAHFLWLIRGLQDYTRALLADYNTNRELGFRGCIEFYFETFEQLYEAINVIESLPVDGERLYYPLPFEPTFQQDSKGGPLGQKVVMRAILPENEEAFSRAVDERLVFLEDPGLGNGRDNMRTLLDIVGDSRDTFLLCCSMKLEGTYCTHSYELIHRNLSGYPEEMC